MIRRLLSLCFLLALAACAQREVPPPSPIDATLRVPTLEFHAPPVDAVVTNVRYTLDRQFGPLVNFYLQDEVAAFGRGEDTAVGELFGTVAVTAEEARRVYAKDPAAGDRRLLGRQVLLSGSVLGMNKDDDQVPYVVLRDGVLLGTKARLARDSAAVATTITKDDDVAFVCTGRGLVARTPLFDDCRPAAAVAQRQTERLASEFARFARGQSVSSEAAELAVRFESLARAVDDRVDCSTGCERRVDYRRAAHAGTLAAIVKSMRAGGLRIDAKAERALTQSTLTAAAQKL